MNNKDVNTILESILKCIYWNKFTVKQQSVIVDILNDEELIDSTSKANEICEFLDIEKRGNRREITNVLDKLIIK